MFKKSTKNMYQINEAKNNQFLIPPPESNQILKKFNGNLAKFFRPVEKNILQRFLFRMSKKISRRFCITTFRENIF